MRQVGRCGFVGVLVVALALGLVGGASLARPAHAQPQEETFVYIVQEGDTCTSLAQRFYGTSRFQIILKYNDVGPAPHFLTPGQRLVLPKPKGMKDEAEAEVAHKTGEVRARAPEDGDWRQAQRGMDLFKAWKVNTLERAFAELEFRDSSQLSMRENTLVVIYGGTSSQLRSEKTRAELKEGTLRHHLDALAGGDGGVEVATPASEMLLRQGSALVSVEQATGKTRVSNHAGEAAAVYGLGKDGKRRGAPTKVAQGTGSKVEVGQKPSKPKPLPPAPAWKGPSLRVVPSFTPALEVVRVLWEPVQSAVSYRVELARDPAGRQVVQSAVTPATTQGAELRELEPGMYWLKVATFDADGFESVPSEPVQVEVVAMELLGPDGRPWRKAEAPSEPPAWTWAGSALTAPLGGTCQTATMPASVGLSLDAPGYVEVACKTAGGAALEPWSLYVRPIDVTLDQPAPILVPRARRDERLTLSARITEEAGGLVRVEGSEGVVVWPLALQDGRFVFDVLVRRDAPTRNLLRFVIPREGGSPQVLKELEVLAE